MGDYGTVLYHVTNPATTEVVRETKFIGEEFPSCVVCPEDQMLSDLSTDHLAFYRFLQCHYYGSLYCLPLSWPTLKTGSKKASHTANTCPALPTLSARFTSSQQLVR